MTRKDFEAIAAALKNSRVEWTGTLKPAHKTVAVMAWESAVDSIAAVFAAGNPRFDLERFRRACGWGA